MVSTNRPAVADMHAAKTHCPQGHEYTEENTYLQTYTLADGTTGQGRKCRICVKESVYRFRAAHPGYDGYQTWKRRERQREREEEGQ